MVTEDFAAVGGPVTDTGGAPLPGARPLGRPALPYVESRGPPGAGLLLEKGRVEPLPVGQGSTSQSSDIFFQISSKKV